MIYTAVHCITEEAEEVISACDASLKQDGYGNHDLNVNVRVDEEMSYVVVFPVEDGEPIGKILAFDQG